MIPGLYVHIPFCSHICAYCDFNKFFYDERQADLYIDALIQEIDEYKIEKVSSIYVGGGTPTSLNLKQLEKLLIRLSKIENISGSFAIEANPENLTEEKIILFKKYGVNRISLGVQSFNSKYLKLMKRKHTNQEVFEVVNLLIKHGIQDINLDLIYGLPGQTKEELNEDLDIYLSLPITHISTYALMINQNTFFGIEKIEEASQDTYREFYDLILKRLEEQGFIRYEVSNFAKRGYQSQHNLLYWHNEPYFGVGISASGYLGKIRYTNTKSLQKYIQGKRRDYQEEVNLKDQEFYFLMLGLRLVEGVSLKEYHRLFNKDLKEIYKEKIEELEKTKLIELSEDYLRITKDNIYIMDYVLEKLLFN